MQINKKLGKANATRAQRQQRRSEALQLIADGVPPTDAAMQLSPHWSDA